MAKAPLDSDVRRLPVTLGILGGIVVSFGTFLAVVVGFQSWVDERINSGVRGYSNELIFPRVEKLESSQKRILLAIENQQHDSEKRHNETTELLEQILRQR